MITFLLYKISALLYLIIVFLFVVCLVFYVFIMSLTPDLILCCSYCDSLLSRFGITWSRLEMQKLGASPTICIRIFIFTRSQVIHKHIKAYETWCEFPLKIVIHITRSFWLLPLSLSQWVALCVQGTSVILVCPVMSSRGSPPYLSPSPPSFPSYLYPPFIFSLPKDLIVTIWGTISNNMKAVKSGTKRIHIFKLYCASI